MAHHKRWYPRSAPWREMALAGSGGCSLSSEARLWHSSELVSEETTSQMNNPITNKMGVSKITVICSAKLNAHIVEKKFNLLIILRA